MKRLFFPLLAIAFAAAGCHSSATTVSNHFAKMTAIASEHAGDCDAMGNALNAYLDANQAVLTEAILHNGSASSEETKQVYDTSFQLHRAAEACTNDSVEAFRKRLADIVLKLPPASK